MKHGLFDFLDCEWDLPLTVVCGWNGMRQRRRKKPLISCQTLFILLIEQSELFLRLQKFIKILFIYNQISLTI